MKLILKFMFSQASIVLNDVTGTFIFAVDSSENSVTSGVNIYVEEFPAVELIDGCYASGGIYEHDDVYLLTTTSCGGSSCAVIDFDVGFCTDYSGCACEITSISGVTIGDQMQVGTYPVSVVVTNDAGIVAERYFNVVVEDSCDPEGPSVECPPDEIVIYTVNSCGAFGIACVEFSENNFSFSCTDYENCDCDWVYSSDSITPGEMLYERKYYLLEIEATNSLGVFSTCISVVTVSSEAP